MRIAALVGVKDEVELIAASLAHLRRIGVDRIIVSDYGSTDGTLDVLADEQRAGDVSVLRVDIAAVPDYATWSAREVRLARQTGADWALFQDADEFWLPASGALRDCGELAVADVLVVDRFNVALASQPLVLSGALTPERYRDLWLFTRQVTHMRSFVASNPQVPFISLRPGPKVMARIGAIEELAPASHDVRAPGAVRRVTPGDLIVAHVPFSTRSRFARKLENMRLELARHADCYTGDLAWHWKRWAAMTDAEAEEEFTRQLLDARTLAALRTEGAVRTVADLFAERGVPLPSEARSAPLLS